MKRDLLAKRVFPGQTQTPGRARIAGRTHIAGPNANYRPDADFRPNVICWPERNLLVLKAKWPSFSFGASDHDGVFSFPAALGGAEAYLFRWLASTTHLLGCSGDNHPLISLKGFRFGPSRTCSVALSRSILSSGGIVAYVVLDYVSRAVYSYR